MASYQLGCLLLCCIFFPAESTNTDILQRIAKLEELQFGCALKYNVLEEKVKIIEKKNDFKDEHMETTIKGLEEKIESLNCVITELTSNQSALSSIHRRQTAAGGVAFSNFLDRDVDHLRPDQAIVFNQVQLNDGNRYSQNTGAFTVPIRGVYLFTFFIGERDPNQLYVKLVVNAVAKSDAVVETVHAAYDVQGGNVVVLRVNKGDAVIIEHNTYGSHIEGSSNKLSTFSGFLLYSLDGEVEELQRCCALKNNVFEEKVKHLEEKIDAQESKLKALRLKDLQLRPDQVQTSVIPDLGFDKSSPDGDV